MNKLTFFILILFLFSTIIAQTGTSLKPRENKNNENVSGLPVESEVEEIPFVPISSENISEFPAPNTENRPDVWSVRVEEVSKPIPTETTTKSVSTDEQREESVIEADKEKRPEKTERAHNRAKTKKRIHENKADEKGNSNRKGRRGPETRPPGWDKGRKTGWGDGDVPPGLRD
ncbi:hypothetical protein DRQ36_04990 [bacterium]|nr:MAG: hypothetical protein DRQ36_04990 [bacterium]